MKTPPPTHFLTNMCMKYLSPTQREQLAINLLERKNTYERLLRGESDSVPRVCLIGDRPGPSAPQDPTYHHTPFYSIKHCSGWLNAQLVLSDISESSLVWINSTLVSGEPLRADVLRGWNIQTYIALGGAAARWAERSGICTAIKVDHPQFWKRFKGSQNYPLLDILSSRLVALNR